MMKFIRKYCISQQHKSELLINWTAAFGIIDNKMRLNKWNPIVISNSYDSVYAQV
jgi:hypothetical protein